MTPTQSQLLRAILESPYDNSIRLIYADLLEEQGAQVRPGLIRCQVALAALQREAGPNEYEAVDYFTVQSGRLESKVEATILHPQPPRVGDTIDLITKHGNLFRNWVVKQAVVTPTNYQDWMQARVTLSPKTDGSSVWETTDRIQREKELVSRARELLKQSAEPADMEDFGDLSRWLWPLEARWLDRGFYDKWSVPLEGFLSHAGEAFAQQPITKIEITSRCPIRTGFVDPPEGVVTYFSIEAQVFVPESACVPDFLWQRYCEYAKGKLSNHSQAPARRYLSQACVDWGREQAGLPPLSWDQQP